MFTTSSAPSASAVAFGTALALLCARPAAADGQSPPTMVSPTALTNASASAVGADYLIGPTDQVDVTVFDSPM